MKTPRIYFYHESPEFRCFVLPDLKALTTSLSLLVSERAFIHIGFKHIDSQLVVHALGKLPLGVYCSGTFLGCDPGESWKFSPAIAVVSNLNSIHLVTHSPVFERAIPEELVNTFQKNEVGGAGQSDARGKVGVPDRMMSSIDWSVRTSNVFERNRIEKLSDLVGWGEGELLALSGFGRKSLSEVESVLAGLGLALTASASGDVIFEDSGLMGCAPKELPLLGNSFYEDINNAIARAGDQRALSIIEMRLGARGEPATLEELGNKLSLTRERVRQIEARAWKRAMSQNPNIIDSWYYELQNLSEASLYPLNFSNLLNSDPRFSNAQKTRQLVKYLFRFYPRFGRPLSDRNLNLVSYLGDTYVSKLNADEVDELEKVIEERLINAPNQSEATIKTGLWNVIPSSHEQFAELIWLKLWSRALTKEEGGELVLVKSLLRSGAERACELLIQHIEETGKPLSNKEVEGFFESVGISVSVRSCFNFMVKNDNVFPSRHGSWTTVSLLAPKPNEITAIKNRVQDIFDGVQEEFHTRELIPHLEGVGIDRFDEFSLTGILLNQTDLTYLGRNVFAVQGSNAETRTKIHDVLVKVLQSENRPLHAKELIAKASEVRSIDPNMQVQAKPPIVLLGANVFGLDFWGL